MQVYNYYRIVFLPLKNFSEKTLTLYGKPNKYHIEQLGQIFRRGSVTNNFEEKLNDERK